MSSSNSRRFRRAGPQAVAALPVDTASNVSIQARKDGTLVENFKIPAEEPVLVTQFVKQALGAMAFAAERHATHTLVLGVVPKWKAWIIRKVLRAV